MASGEGPGADDLTLFDRFCGNPRAFHIFLALRILEARDPGAPALGTSRRPGQDRVRLGQQPTLAFPPTAIESYHPPEGATPGRLVNLFFGLFGPHGPLPTHLTEYARERQRAYRDHTFVGFADMLTHRSMTLLYRAWGAGQPAPDLDRGEGGRIEQHVAALAGLRGAAMRRRDAMPDLAKRHFAGHLGRRSKNGQGLEAILSAFFGASVRLQEFVGSWLHLDPGDRWRLGAPSRLGGGTVLGSAVWSRSAKFRIRIGPLDLQRYRGLLPGGSALDRLGAIIRSYCGDTLDWDVNLVLAGEEVPRARLGCDTSLGRVSWLGERQGAGDAADLFLARADIVADHIGKPARPAEESLA
jgi:type VI secretion system protein ImpH